MELEQYQINKLSELGKVDAVEKEFLKLPQAPCPVIHSFGPGVYLRQVSIHAGTFAIGHHQNFEHMNIMIKGKVSIKNEDGTVSTLTAPISFVGKPGRKIGYIHEDMVWINVYSTTETDIEKLEAHYLTKSDGWLESSTEQAFKQIKNVVDQDDYLKIITEIGFTEEQVRAVSETIGDQINLPPGSYKIKLAKSSIEGRGIFATADISTGEIVGPSRISGMRTIIGRYTNHSKSPNAEMIATVSGDIYLMAIAPISGCHGGNDGDEITINYKDAYNLNLKISQGGISCPE